MKNINKLPLLLILFSQILFSQLYKTNDWLKKPEFYAIDSDDLKLPSVAIKEKHIIQYYKSSVISRNIKLYQTTHSIIQVNTDKGINRHNKVYIPMRNVVKVIDIKARVITPDGKVKLLNKDNIKELNNIKEYGNFKIFAIEGLTKNSQLEYIYTIQKKLSSIGSIILQKDYKINECELVIIDVAGNHIKYKNYNNFPALEKRTLNNKSIEYRGIAYDIPSMINEKNSAYIANRMKVTYMLKSNSSFLKDDELWNNLETNIRNNFINLKPSRYKKLINDYQSFCRDKKINSEEDKINQVCDYIHKNFYIDRKKSMSDEVLTKAINNKQISEFGVVKLYSILFNYLKIPFDIVLTSNRFHHKFDRNFYSQLNLQELFIYFSNTNKYIEPTSVLTFLGHPSKDVIGNEGIYIGKNTKQIKLVDILDKDYTQTNRIYKVKINTINEMVEVSCEESLSGYKAENNRGAYRYFKKNNINEYINNTVSSAIEDLDVHSFTVTNEELDNITKNIPFKISYKYSAESLFEALGSSIIFNIGKLIGKQTELYQEVERVNPIEINYLNEYNYTFDVKIPNGYKVSNSKDFNNYTTLKDSNGKIICQFRTESKIVEGSIVVNVSEFYNKLILDKKYYDNYRDVINAAFDFSKKSILFEKE